MDTGFIDLDILLTRIRHPQSKVYFLDAIKAYKAGALRASMTSAWVALVYDLIAKYRELSAFGDATATSFIHSWDTATAANNIQQLLKLEATILDDATTNTQVINQISHTHLTRLREDRHLCAHPAFSAEAELFEPPSELVRLHLVNAVNLVLSQEPLQGKAIFALFDADVKSPGFPSEHSKILNYVEHRYLNRVRPQNIHNFGVLLAKSLLMNVPPQWEALHHKITSSLVAIRERSTGAWPTISQSIVRLLDNLDPERRALAVSFLSAFPDFWPSLQEPTRTALQETVENIDPNAIDKYRILEGIVLPQFRPSLLNLINRFTSDNLANAIAEQPLHELWPRAIELYRNSGSYRNSESNFRGLIAPFAGRLEREQHDQLLNAICANSQNWNAGDTDTLLLGMLHNSAQANYPTPDQRNHFYHQLRSINRLDKFAAAITLLQSDGWTPIPPEQEINDE